VYTCYSSFPVVDTNIFSYIQDFFSLPPFLPSLLPHIFLYAYKKINNRTLLFVVWIEWSVRVSTAISQHQAKASKNHLALTRGERSISLWVTHISNLFLSVGSRDSVAGIMTWLRTGIFGSRSAIPGRSKKFLSSPKCPDRSNQPRSQGLRWAKQPGSEAHPLPLIWRRIRIGGTNFPCLHTFQCIVQGQLYLHFYCWLLYTCLSHYSWRFSLKISNVAKESKNGRTNSHHIGYTGVTVSLRELHLQIAWNFFR
jgi:hypothetical protein